MRAHTGDWLIVKGRTDSSAARRAMVLEAHGPDGSAPFLVRWIDSGHEALLFRDRMRSSSPPPSRQSKIARLAAASISFNPHWKGTGRFRGTRDLMSDTVQEPS